MEHYAPQILTAVIVTEPVIPPQALDPHTKLDIVTSTYKIQYMKKLQEELRGIIQENNEQIA